MVTEDDCIHALREAAQILEKSPTKAEYEDLDITPSASTILRHCGGWNDAKEQAGLETAYSTGSRVEPKPDDLELPDGMIWEELSQDQRWHYKNRDRDRPYTRRWKQQLRRWVYDFKCDRGCSKCGLNDGACLDFHHQDTESKEMKISKMVTFGRSKAALRAEIEKCTILCVNCHRREHYETPPGIDWVDLSTDPRTLSEQTNGDPQRPAELRDRQQAWVHEYKRVRGCRECGAGNPGCLDLHHIDEEEKSRSVSQLIAYSCSWEQLQQELEKCVVLCANCHRKKHYEEPEPESV